MNWLNLFLLSTIFIASSCSKAYTVEGNNNLTPINGKTAYLKQYSNGLWQVLDSASINHSKYKLEGKVNKPPLLATLFIDDIAITPIVLEAGLIKVDLNKADLLIQGTALNNKLNKFYQSKYNLDIKLINALQQNQGDDIIQYIVRANEQLIKDFAIDNKSNILGPTILSVYHNSYPNLSKCDDIKPLFDSPFFFIKNDLNFPSFDSEDVIEFSLIDFIIR